MERQLCIVFIYYQKLTHSICQVSLLVKYIISLIQHFEADFLWKVSLKILNSGLILKTFIHVYVRYNCIHHLIRHAQLSSRARGLHLGLNLHLHIYLVCKNSEGSWETAWMQRLIRAFVACIYAISIKISLADSFVIGLDKQKCSV